MPSFTSSTVPTSRTSISARLAAWISLRRMSLSSPGFRMESVAMGCPLGDCEKYHIAALPPPRAGSAVSYSRSGPASNDPGEDAPRPDGAQLLGGGAGHAPRGGREMAGRRVPEDFHHRPDRIARVAE